MRSLRIAIGAYLTLIVAASSVTVMPGLALGQDPDPVDAIVVNSNPRKPLTGNETISVIVKYRVQGEQQDRQKMWQFSADGYKSGAVLHPGKKLLQTSITVSPGTPEEMRRRVKFSEYIRIAPSGTRSWVNTYSIDPAQLPSDGGSAGPADPGDAGVESCIVIEGVDTDEDGLDVPVTYCLGDDDPDCAPPCGT